MTLYITFQITEIIQLSIVVSLIPILGLFTSCRTVLHDLHP